jgi:hypothetical protein
MAGMINSAPVRKHHTPVQRQALLRDYRQSQLTQKQFASQVGIGVSTLQSWIGKAPPEPAAKGAAFIAVPNLLGATSAPCAYRLQVPGGISLEIGSGFELEELAALVELLRGL